MIPRYAWPARVQPRRRDALAEGMTPQVRDAANYALNARIVSDLARVVLDLLAPRAAEQLQKWTASPRSAKSSTCGEGRSAIPGGTTDQRTKWYRPSQVNTPAGSELKSEDTRTFARSPASAAVPSVSTQVPSKVL